MLQKLNERIQGVVAWLVIILIAITFTLFGVDYYLQSHQTSNAKVMINDQPITNQAFEANYRRSRAQQDLAQMTAADEKILQNKVLNQMITNEVTLQSAWKNGFDVSLNQANAAIVTIPQFQQDGHFSSERYQQALNSALFTPETFQKEVRQGMLLNQQRFAFIGTSFALPDEVNRFVRLYMQTRDFDYLTVSSSHFIDQIKISPEEISNYYKDHKNEFKTPEQVTVDYVILSLPEIKSKITISKDDIKRYYDENKSNYLTPAQWQVAHILFAVPENATKADLEQAQQKADEAYAELQKNPKGFDKLMSQVSDDKLSLADKGVLPWITAGNKDYDKALSTLTESGQISAPEKTKHGFEIFKLIAYKPVITKSLADVQTIIKEQLIADMAQAQYAQSLEQLSDLSYQTPDSLKPAADALKLKVQQSEPFSRSGGTSNLSKNKQVVNTAYSHDVLGLSNNSEAVQLDNESVVVLRINQHIPSKQQALSEVHDQIKKLLAKKQADIKASKIGNALLASVDNKQQQALMTENKLEWHSITQASRDNEKTSGTINDLAFNLLKPEAKNGLALENGDYVVVKLKQINDGELSALDKEHSDSLMQQIESSYGMMDYDLYVNNLMKKAKIS